MIDDIHRDALISGDGVYRYWLSRTWPDWQSDGRHTLLWLMLNPSTADAEIDDPTIRRIMGFTCAWHYRRAVVCNLFALRATDPRALAREDDPVGPDNDRWLRHHAARAETIVCAWGAHRLAEVREAEVTALLRHYAPLHHLGQTRAGAPKHPLYLPKVSTVQLWMPRMEVA